MQSAFATHSLIWAANPEHLLLGALFLLAALILFSLALEAGTYPGIAEEAPERVATNDHKSLSPMDIVAVLATMTKDQEAAIDALRNESRKIGYNKQ
jgi:hypothetical protein